jgi:uncharacterized protein (TIGR02145 family)
MFLFGNYRKFLFFIYCISAISLFSQVPNGINYQTKLRANSGYVLSNKSVDLQFEIININNNLSVYKETQKSNTDQFGLVDMVIGNGNAISGSLGSIPWGNGSYELSVYIDTSGFGNYKLMGTSKLYSVPYALYAKNSGVDADWYPAKPGNKIYNIKDSIGIGTMTPSEKVQVIGNIKTEGFIMVPGAQQGYVLTTDNNGVSSWQPAIGGGSIGPTGATGPGGGPQGPTGSTGTRGPSGYNGADGIQGPSGFAGINGTTGSTGTRGPSGHNGADGSTGASGIDGNTGATGPKGSTGPAGGAQGVTGPTGPSGGPKGVTGPTGPAGGPIGPTGTQGPSGSNGIDGKTGPTGLQGIPGPTGAGSPDNDWVENTNDVYNITHNIGIGTNSPVHKLHIQESSNNNVTSTSHTFYSDARVVTGSSANGAIGAKTRIAHGSGSGTITATSFQGYAESNSWPGTNTLIGVHGMSEYTYSNGGGGNPTQYHIGVLGEATTDNPVGIQTMIGGRFTATNGDNNIAIQTINGKVQFQVLGGGGTQMVIADNNGTLSVQPIPTGGNGATGNSGTNGKTGATGNNGLNGKPGHTGPSGANGLNGTPGHTGTTGNNGNTGPSGYDGSDGKTGPTGNQGLRGITGPTGAGAPDSDWTVIGNDMYSAPPGNIGIGTATPSNKLSINGELAIGSTYSTTNTAPVNGLLVEGQTVIGGPAPVGAVPLTVYSTNPAINGAAIYSQNTNPTLGIGIFGEGSLHGIYGRSNNTFSVLGSAGSFNQLGIGAIIQALDNGNEVFRVNDGGNVGIGTIDPLQALHIGNGGAMYLEGAFHDGTNNPGLPNYILKTNGTSTEWVDPNSLGLGGGSDNDWIENSGSVYNITDNIGIGVASPTANLHIKGTSGATGTSGPFTSLEISDGTTGGSRKWPINGFHHNTRTQIIYTASELLTAGITTGNIDALWLDISLATCTNPLPDLEISMGHTALNAFINPTFIIPNNQTTVFPATNWTAPGSIGWEMITFTNSFNWNGIDNIVVSLCWGKAGVTACNGSGMTHVNCSQTIKDQIILKNSASTGSQCTEVSGYVMKEKPNIKFNQPYSGGSGSTNTTLLRIVDGNEGTGKVLTSDANGYANWQTPAGGTGATGNDGHTGPSGANGLNGKPGHTGPTGNNGLNGKPGHTGPSGANGLNGKPGHTGPTGNNGLNGKPGHTGPSGVNGLNGKPGHTGPTGPSGSSLIANNMGDMQFWNGSEWVVLPAPNPPALGEGYILTFIAGIPQWAPCCAIGATGITGSTGTSGPPAPTGATVDACDGETFVQDYEGNSYNIVEIGTHCWMSENLKSKLYSDGTPLQNGASAGNIVGNYTDKYYFSYNNNITNSNDYGHLYTWAAAMNGATSSTSIPSNIQGTCPSGWHLPSDAEWNILMLYVGGIAVSAGELKEDNTTHWMSPNITNADNYSFTALPGGLRNDNGFYVNMTNIGYWFSATESSSTHAISYFMSNADIYTKRMGLGKANAFSVRCVKD